MANLTELLAEANDLQAKNDHEKAATVLTAALEQMQPEYPAYAATRNNRGFSRVMTGDYDGAFEDNLTALTQAKNDDKEQKARALVDMSYVLRVGYKQEEASRKACQIAAEVADDNTFIKAKALEFEGRTYIHKGQSEKMIACFSGARDVYQALLEENPDDKTLKQRLGDSLHSIGLGHYELKEFDQAYKLQEEADAIHREIGNDVGRSNAVSRMGRIDFERGDYDKALTKYYQVNYFLTKMDHKRGLAINALAISQANLANNDPQEAIPYLEKFAKGISSGEMTQYDLEVDKKRVSDVIKRVMDLELEVEGFEIVMSREILA